MREHTYKFWLAALLLLMVPHLAHAVGLGRLNVLSAIGQPFSAEIELVNVQKEEAASLAVRLASPEVYQRSNLQYNSALQGMRLSIDKRPNGALFIRAASTRVVSEPFLDLLIELQWGGGSILREYSALLDPPGMERPAPVAAAPAPAATPIARPAPQQPAAAAPGPATAAAGSEYTVKPGDTMGRIAASVKPEGVSLEQALVSIFRSNPDAFINNNVNLVRSGKILRVPEKSQMAAIPQPDAARELRVQTESWNSYRQKVADAAPQVPDSKPATSGKITARVDDKAAADGAKDVVRLSKGDAGAQSKGKDARPAADRIRALEEELVAREKALAEANDRVKALEKTLKDMQKLVELKGGAPIAPKPDAKAGAAAPAPKAAPAKADDKAAPAADKPAEKAPEPKKADKAPAPKPAVKAPPPKPEPGIMDTVMDNIVPIGTGGAVLVGLGAFWALRRRRQSGGADQDQTPASPAAKTEPSVAAVAAGAAVGAVAATAAADTAPAAAASESVDPMDEAQVYLDHGRDAQAEDILKDAMQKDPQREDLQLKLLEIYAGRGDKDAFNALAVGYNALTGGQGDKWTHAAAMGYALDPDNAFYAAGKGVSVDVTAGGAGDGGNLDFDIGAGTGTSTDIELDVEAPAGDLEKTQVLGGAEETAAQEAVAGEPIPEFNLDFPGEGKDAASAQAEAKPATEEPALDFNIELPSLDTPPAEPAPAAAPAADEAAGLDFKVDLGNLDLKLDDKAPAAAAGEVKDPHWEDVQQKFDLARAYQEMGDKEGAREILQEVMREGSEQQKAEAEKLIASLH